MKNVRGWRRIVAAIAALLLVAAACGDDSDPGSTEGDGDSAPASSDETEESESSDAAGSGDGGSASVDAPVDTDLTIGFLAGVDDPFYITMQRGAERAAAALGVSLEVQIPADWNVTEQTPILDAMAASGNLDFLFLAPVDKEAMVAPLENTGLPFLTVDTFIGDGDYVNGPVTSPLSYIGSANEEGGRLACEALIEAIGGSGSIYIQNVLPGISTTDQRQEGCEAAIDAASDVTLVGVDFNDNDPAKAAAQTEAALLANTIDGIFGTNVFSAEGAGNVVANQGAAVKVVAFDATSRAIELLREGVVSHVIAQKPADMGFQAVIQAVAYLNGVQSIPPRVQTGYQVMTIDNVDDPAVAQYIYSDAAAAPVDTDLTIGFLAGVDDPFYITMQRGAERAAAALGVSLEVQIPADWNVTEQTPILDAMAASGNLDFLFLAPVDKEAMVAPLENTGLPFLTVDTFIGDGDYVNGPVTSPLSYIGSANEEGGRLACEALIEAIGGSGSIYIQNVLPGISTTDQRQEGCEAAIDAASDVTLVGVDFNDNDPAKAAAQTEAALLANTIDGIFGTNVFSAEGAGNVVANQGAAVKVVAFDATSRAIELLREGVVSHVIAQKPADMGFQAVIQAVAYLNGVQSIPPRVQTGYQVMTIDNVDDPAVAQYIYTG